jgi:hypothetical protein
MTVVPDLHELTTDELQARFRNLGTAETGGLRRLVRLLSQRLTRQ